MALISPHLLPTALGPPLCPQASRPGSGDSLSLKSISLIVAATAQRTQFELIVSARGAQTEQSHAVSEVSLGEGNEKPPRLDDGIVWSRNRGRDVGVSSSL